MSCIFLFPSLLARHSISLFSPGSYHSKIMTKVPTAHAYYYPPMLIAKEISGNMISLSYTPLSFFCPINVYLRSPFFPFPSLSSTINSPLLGPSTQSQIQTSACRARSGETKGFSVAELYRPKTLPTLPSSLSHPPCGS